MGKGAAKQADVATKQMMDIAQQTFTLGKGLEQEAAPARQTAQDAYMAMATGKGADLQRSMAPSINAATQQYYLQRKQAQEMAPGGLRDVTMRDINLQEAGTKTGIYSGGVSEALARLAAMGSGGTQAGIGAYGQAQGGYGQAGQAYAQLSASQAGAWGSLAGGLGSMAGGFMAMKGK
jgi:hypothetical protein